MSMIEFESKDKWKDFFNQYYSGEILKQFREIKTFNIDFSLIDIFDPVMADEFLKNSKIALENMKKAFFEYLAESYGYLIAPKIVFELKEKKS